MEQRVQQGMWALDTLDPSRGIYVIRLGWTTNWICLLESGDRPNSQAPFFEQTEAATQLPRPVTEVSPEPQECLGHSA